MRKHPFPPPSILLFVLNNHSKPSAQTGFHPSEAKGKTWLAIEEEIEPFPRIDISLKLRPYRSVCAITKNKTEILMLESIVIIQVVVD